ncbi:related to MAP kinase [Ustilago sp. UG-2017a]|nr:related to MAP kinase [Ustilago sp. UG-2017a]
MPAPQSTPPPPPHPTSSSAASVAASSKTLPPPPSPSPSPSPSSPVSVIHQVGSRQATRTRTRTRRNMSSTSGLHRAPRYSNDDHPMAPHNLAARGYHSFRSLGVPFHVKQRYTFLRELGIGAYGCVALCRDEVLECNVAIKKVARIFEKDVLARRALREVALLRHIGMCDNVTALLDFDTAFIDFSEIYLVLSASEADLSQIIRSGQALSDAHHQYFIAQILRGVRYMHAANVIHRDLKPSNLLVNGDCALRICDLGLARAYAHSDQSLAPPPASAASADQSQAKPGSSISSHPPELNASPPPRSPSPASDLHLQLYKTDSKGKQKRLNFPGGPLTGYVATRWYRAPEVMLCFREGYGPEMDMWSVGCILAELIAGAPIFGGKDYVDQIARINNVLGSPSEALLHKIGSERAKTYIKSLPNMPAVPLEKLYPNANPEALDLVAKLLTWDPDQRLTAEQALMHPWLKAYHESNARWQSPQPFDKFAELEFIRSLPQFKRSLQREADEMSIELEEIEREEIESLGGGADQGQVANGGMLMGEMLMGGMLMGEMLMGEMLMGEMLMQVEQTTGDANANANRDAHHLDENAENNITDKADSGNVQRADDAFDQPTTAHDHQQRGQVDADAPAQSHLSHHDHHHNSSDDLLDHGALSCDASTRSGHLPADTASSSSIHTPPSTSGASADEAEPPSPRLYNAASCTMSTPLQSRPEHLEQGKALRKPPSSFRLGHEAEGRLLQPFSLEEARRGDVFMPNQVLTVARGLVEYQYTAGAGGETTCLPTQQQPLSRSDTIKASSHSSRGAVTGAATSSSVPSGRATSGRGGGGGVASTPSLGQSLLDDIMFAPADGSSSGLKSVSSHRYGKQLVILQDSLVQSSTPLIRELIARSAQRNHPVLLVSTLRRPETYLDGIAAERVATIDATTLANAYDPDAIKSTNELTERIKTQLSSLNASTTKTTVIIDSLNVVSHVQQNGVAGTSKLVREALSSIGASGKFIVGLQMGGVETSTCAALISALHSPLIWGSSSLTSAAAGGAGGTVLSTTIHPPALLRHIFKQYTLKPPSSSSAVRRALDFADEGQEEEVDVRFWDVLRNVASRGPMGVAEYEAGGHVPGWWVAEQCAFESLSAIATEGGRSGESEGGQAMSCITLADLLNPSRTGYAILECHYTRNGKKYEEIIGLISSISGKGLGLVPLDMVDHSTPSTCTSASAPADAGGDKHNSMLGNLSFNLNETWEQRSRRETVPLPYAYHQNATAEPAIGEQGGAALRGTTRNAKIFFEPEADDDEDDEDPDDDLDL